MKKIRKGFTLIEMVIVLFIISLLLLLMIPNLVKQKDGAQKKSDEALRTTIVTQAQMYSENNDDNNADNNADNKNNDNTKVNLNTLHSQHYITDKQYEQAKKIGFTDNTDLLAVNITELKDTKANNAG